MAQRPRVGHNSSNAQRTYNRIIGSVVAQCNKFRELGNVTGRPLNMAVVYTTKDGMIQCIGSKDWTEVILSNCVDRLMECQLERTESHDDTNARVALLRLPKPVSQLNSKTLQSIIPVAMKNLQGGGYVKWGQLSSKPEWWPDHVVFANVKQRPSTQNAEHKWVDCLRDVLIAMYSHYGYDAETHVELEEHSDSDDHRNHDDDDDHHTHVNDDQQGTQHNHENGYHDNLHDNDDDHQIQDERHHDDHPIQDDNHYDEHQNHDDHPNHDDDHHDDHPNHDDDHHDDHPNHDDDHQIQDEGNHNDHPIQDDDHYDDHQIHDDHPNHDDDQHDVPNSNDDGNHDGTHNHNQDAENHDANPDVRFNNDDVRMEFKVRTPSSIGRNKYCPPLSPIPIDPLSRKRRRNWQHDETDPVVINYVSSLTPTKRRRLIKPRHIFTPSDYL